MTSGSDKRQTHVRMEHIKTLQSLPSIPEPKELFARGQPALREGSRSPDHLPQESKRRKTGSPEARIVETRAGPEKLLLPKAVDVGIRSYKYVELKYESPWHSLQRVYELKLDGFIIVVTRKPSSCEIVIVKNFVGLGRDEKLKRLQQTQTRNFQGFLDAFESEGSVYVVLEYVSISLAHMVASSVYSTELQLAAILGQITQLFCRISEQMLTDADSRRSCLSRLYESRA